ncbi:MAG TPA: HAMP domain-containing sensor histidine kinase [Burkholderiales bacterium]|nr:HAMP domain-containing sensor histidine kinase [Burkholderiales bacterium]
MAYPRSFLGLCLASFILVAVPLVAALAYSAWHSERLAERSRSAVFNASQAARASRTLVNRISSLERLATLDAPGFDADLGRVHTSFRQVAHELLQLPLEEDQRAALLTTMDQEQGLYQLLTAPRSGQGGAERRHVAALAADLAENASEVLAISTRVADREVERLRADAESVQRQLVLLVIFSTAVALGLALALTRHIARPIAELDGAIRQLGGADFERPIAVRGPQDLKTLGERLDWLRRRLVELEDEKNRFLRHLSHELKTPLTALREGAELLHDEVGGKLSDSQRRVVGIMKDNSIKLQRLIEDLLDYQRALHAAAALQVKPVSLKSVIQEAMRSHELAAQAKGLHIEVDAQAATVVADPEKLRSVVDNLIGNAVKFTPSGGSVAVLARSSGDQALIDVIDSGPGVPAEERDSIFDSFFRGRAKASARVEGSGLGLAIAREFVEAHGGSIHVLAEEHGAHFRVALPRHLAA